MLFTRRDPVHTEKSQRGELVESVNSDERKLNSENGMVN
jgi:hypothetical protein